MSLEYASLLRPSAIIYHRLIEEMDARHDLDAGNPSGQRPGL